MNLHIGSSQFFDAAWRLLDSERVVSIRAIQDASCEYFGVKRTEIMSPRKDRLVCNARMMAMYLACELTDRSLPEVGRMFHRDHTTILHGRNKMRQQVKENTFFENAASELTAIIEGAKHD